MIEIIINNVPQDERTVFEVKNVSDGSGSAKASLAGFWALDEAQIGSITDAIRRAAQTLNGR